MKRLKKEEMKSLMIDHIDGNLTGELGKYVDRQIEKDPEAKRQYHELKLIMDMVGQEEELEVPTKGKEEFMAFLEKEKSTKPNGKIRKITSSFSLNNIYKVAAAVALILVGYIGSLWLNKISDSEFQVLQDELTDMKELVFTSMIKQKSPSERIKGVKTVYDLKNANTEILDALILTMNQDDNMNVRIAAIEALAVFADDDLVRKALIESLFVQENPTVQIKLINVLVLLKEKDALEPLQEIIDDQNIQNFVKDEAQFGIYKLL